MQHALQADVETLAIFYDGKRLHGFDGGRDRQLLLALNVATHSQPRTTGNVEEADALATG